MFYVLTKRIIFAVFLCFAIIFSMIAVIFLGAETAEPVFALRDGLPVTVVIDPGHGGEDGGAVSANGVEESRINLEIALRLEQLLRFAGQRTDMTRRADESTCDPGLDTVRARKASDLRNRTELVNRTENAVLISIHQNSLPQSPVTHGAQAFRNREEGAEALAEAVQTLLNEQINDRPKEPRLIPDTIYLMNHVQAPAVLVECGFLSNGEDTRLLQESGHQLKLASIMAAAFLRCAAEGEAI